LENLEVYVGEIRTMMIQKLHTKFCKFILGVHKKPTNFDVLAELGLFPLYYDIIKSIFHYWNRLEYLETFPLLQNAYEQSKQICRRYA
jgi:hypothetical protein